jgi:mono/diheme cytochrome c family protein
MSEKWGFVPAWNSLLSREASEQNRAPRRVAASAKPSGRPFAGVSREAYCYAMARDEPMCRRSRSPRISHAVRRFPLPPWSWFVLAAAMAACGDSGARPAQVALPQSAEELAEGEAVFERFCVQCHGPAASGTDQGPPLVHRIYEPRHHSDYAFVLAIRQGVRAHHWRFGDMPPVAGLTPEQELRVIAYIRHLQREAGIF